MEIVADWNQVERYRRDNIRSDIIDFNGYWGGNLTIIVPTGWSVKIAFINGSSLFSAQSDGDQSLCAVRDAEEVDARGCDLGRVHRSARGNQNQ